MKSKTKLYRVWRNTKDKCNNEKGRSYKYFGEKGIQLCKEWNDFPTFEKWALENKYNDGLCLGRKDQTKNFDCYNSIFIAKNTSAFYSKKENSKLSEMQAKEIRKKYIKGEVKQISLAYEYKVSVSTICKILKNKRWRQNYGVLE